MTSPADEVVISVDSHIAEPEELWDRLPEEMQCYRSTDEVLPDGSERSSVEGAYTRLPRIDALSEDDLDCEYRRDDSGARDLDRRRADMAREGVDAQVIFPEVGLGLGMGNGSREYHNVIARAYNDWIHEALAPDAKRFLAAALIPIDEVEDAIAEAKRCIDLGFNTLFLPVTVPWKPYWHPDYEPLWSLIEEARVPISFHVFSGNLYFGTDFAFLPFLTPEQYEASRKVNQEIGDVPERMATTVVGMAAGMGPIIHLTGSGVLERHPNLRFAIIEAECGWLAWSLSAMDSMQEKRHLYLEHLPLKASEYFRRQGSVSISDDPAGVHNFALTGCDCILWGNDYPHDEGTFPNSRPIIEAMRESVEPGDMRKILGENAAKLYGFDLDFLADHRLDRHP